ncbi:MAG TPA: chlorophyllase [Candidatus Dormibacteraeota bacterium]|nr:chlorophyllase [Candidatus Dormibacteraeota bacterium]
MRRHPAALTLLLALVALPACAHAARPAATGPPPPTGHFAVGLRTLTFTDPSRVTDPTPNQPGDEIHGRTLVTTVWYPAAGAPAAASRTGAPPAAGGPFPVVLLSHGLLGVPADYQAIATRWAAAGFVVAAPAYPLTSRGAGHVQVLDVANQPADASFVLTSLLALAGQVGDPLHGVLDGGRAAAAGHSAGAVTTVGLFTACCRDPRLRAGVVLAGNATGFGGGFAGRPAPILFEHGDRDPIVPIATGRLTWDVLPWPKAFVTLEGQGHIDPYLRADSPAFDVVAATTTDFLRWALDGDQAALARLRQEAAAPGLSRLDDRL